MFLRLVLGAGRNGEMLPGGREALWCCVDLCLSPDTYMVSVPAWPSCELDQPAPL